jgi:ubiquinone/menaquinone biosynthesis C-methylase UbiE
LVARQFVAWLGVPPNKDWLDVGSGTGALCEVILAGASPHQVMGVDPSDGLVSFARHKVIDKRVTKRTFRGSVPMSAFGGEADADVCL